MIIKKSKICSPHHLIFTHFFLCPFWIFLAFIFIAYYCSFTTYLSILLTLIVLLLLTMIDFIVEILKSTIKRSILHLLMSFSHIVPKFTWYLVITWPWCVYTHVIKINDLQLLLVKTSLRSVPNLGPLLTLSLSSLKF